LEGFIGRNLAEYFSEKNTCVSVGNEKSLFEKRGDAFFQAKPYEEKIEHESDVIVHLIDNKVSMDSFVEQEKKLVESIGLNSEHHLIVFSSAVVYANPDSEYGQRKQAMEKLYTAYCEDRGIQLTILRLFNTFGPYQIPYRQGSLVGNIMYNALDGKQTQINDREATRDFLYSGDIPKFVEYVIVNNMKGVYDIGSGALTSIRELITLLEGKIIKKSFDMAYRDIRETLPSRSAKSNLLGGVKLTNLEEGLRRTMKFYEDNMPIVKSYVE
jgi:nucleoside-diphosphate-sugar epimerase